MSDEFVVCQILQVGISWEVPVRNTNATRLQMQFVIDEKNRIIFFLVNYYFIGTCFGQIVPIMNVTYKTRNRFQILCYQ